MAYGFENNYRDTKRSRPYDRAGGKRKTGNIKNIKIAGAVGVSALLLLNVICFVVLLGGPSAGKLLNIPKALDMTDDVMYDSVFKPYIDKCLDETTVSVSAGGASKELKLSDCDFSFEYGADGRREMVAAAAGDTIGREEHLYCTCGTLRFDQTKLRSFLDGLVGSGSVPVVDSYYTVDYDNSVMTVHSGTDGYGVDTKDFVSQLLGIVSAGAKSGSISCTPGTVNASSISADELYLWAHKEAKDAYSVDNPDGSVTYFAETVGVDFDKNTAASVLAAGGTKWDIPVSVTRPKVDLKELKKYTFPDLLATYHTFYSASNKQRAANLSLAASKINGTVLEPGQQLSFNGTVGERTPENGFQMATVYTNEGTEEGYGGGICQTSSTLYYTCILANLKIDERKNHMYVVTYMRDELSGYNVYGNDATVSWGAVDYKFTNSKQYPIKIFMNAEGGKITCEIRGTADGSTARFVYENKATVPYTVVYKQPAAGKTNQSGHTGRTVEAYRVVFSNGKEISRTLEHKNVYKMMPQYIYTNEIPAGAQYNVEYTQAQKKAFDSAPKETEATTQQTTETPPTEPPAPTEPAPQQ